MDSTFCTALTILALIDSRSAMGVYSELLVAQNEARGDRFFELQSMADAAERTLRRLKILPAPRSPFPAY